MQFKTESEASQLLHIIPKQHCLILAELSCMNSMQTLLQANNICTTKFDDISFENISTAKEGGNRNKMSFLFVFSYLMIRCFEPRSGSDGQR